MIVVMVVVITVSVVLLNLVVCIELLGFHYCYTTDHETCKEPETFVSLIIQKYTPFKSGKEFHLVVWFA